METDGARLPRLSNLAAGRVVKPTRGPSIYESQGLFVL